jgi:trigger factor
MKLNKIAALLLAVVVLATSFVSCSNNSSRKEFDYSAGLTEDGFFENIKASDYVTLPDYKNTPISPQVLVASEEALNEQLASILSRYTTYHEITDRAVADGDTVNIDYVGKIDGKEFSGGSTNGAGTDVTIGVTQYIDDFLEQLIGHKPGETFDIEVTFPDPYQNNPDLSGKDAVFTVTINHIRGDAIDAELTDEIAAEYGFDTKEELVADIEAWIINQQKMEFFDELMAEVECDEVPDALLDYVKNLDVASIKDYAALNNIDLDTFMATFMGYDSLDAYLDAQADAYKEMATRYLIVQAIAETEGLSATDEDINEAGYTDYIKTHGRPYLKLLLLHSKIVPNFVADNAKVHS